MSAGQYSQTRAQQYRLYVTPVQSAYPASWGAQPRSIEAGLLGDCPLTELRHTGQSDQHHLHMSAVTATPRAATDAQNKHLSTLLAVLGCLCGMHFHQSEI